MVKWFFQTYGGTLPCLSQTGEGFLRTFVAAISGMRAIMSLCGTYCARRAATLADVATPGLRVNNSERLVRLATLGSLGT